MEKNPEYIYMYIYIKMNKSNKINNFYVVYFLMVLVKFPSLTIAWRGSFVEKKGSIF